MFIDDSSILFIAVTISFIFSLFNSIWFPSSIVKTFVLLACSVETLTFSFICPIAAINSWIIPAWFIAPSDIIWAVDATCSEPSLTCSVTILIS